MAARGSAHGHSSAGIFHRNRSLVDILHALTVLAVSRDSGREVDLAGVGFIVLQEILGSETGDSFVVSRGATNKLRLREQTRREDTYSG